ncbi:MAG: ribosomal protein S12 methylthiotransferase RimO [Omnitrophica WOR_2 bacterium RIFCSPHIGHO2_02_FULL_52_10]|nr:MAG: ribosomal protein S12 methylthiotransferase RimO [Omnitrophica WOR_2 bacterium RIFCSPHIGHO2_02_FULL_52_10]
MKTIKDFYSERHAQGRNVGVINLGCARNLVDAQVILGHLKRTGHHIVDVADADIAIVNTCGFIEAAKKESIDTIIELLELKKQGKLKKVIVAGCLAQRYSDELIRELDGIDAIVGAQQLDREALPEQVLLTPGHFAYVKICESCYNQCSFCIIPKIKGKFTSRTMESVFREVKQLDERGVKEVLMIGQDITAYGMDIYREMSLAKLLKEITAAMENIQWIRLLYTFPAHVTDELIDVIAGEEKICKYIDMPIQHISDNLLKSMNRGITTREIRELIGKIRVKIPGASIRTTFIVGLPGETSGNYKELLDFVQETRFDKMGVFVYSREEGTPAYAMPGQVPETVKKERMNRLMQLQRDISMTAQQKMVGRSMKVLVDEEQKEAKGVYLGRSEYDAPEVDGSVYVHSARKLKPGDFVTVKITDALEYDLVGEAA